MLSRENAFGFRIRKFTRRACKAKRPRARCAETEGNCNSQSFNKGGCNQCGEGGRNPLPFATNCR